MSSFRYPTIALLLIATVGLGCRPSGQSVEASDVSRAVQPLAGGGVETEVVAENPAPDLAAAAGSALGDDELGPFGLLAPAVPGFSLGAYASTCDPFEDPYAACL